MKKLFIKALTVCIPILLCAFTGCETTVMLQYNAKDIGNLSEFKEDFLKANGTGGMWGRDETLPEDRTYIITEKAQLDEVFSVCPEIDFEKEMVVMYGYTSIYNGRQQKITSITLDNKILKIKFKYVKARPFVADASSPLTRFLVIKMDKLDIDTVGFTLLNPRG